LSVRFSLIAGSFLNSLNIHIHFQDLSLLKRHFSRGHCAYVLVWGQGRAIFAWAGVRSDALCRIFRCIRNSEHAAASKVDLKSYKTLVPKTPGFGQFTLLYSASLALLDKKKCEKTKPHELEKSPVLRRQRTSTKSSTPTSEHLIMDNYPPYFLIIAAVLMPHPAIALCPVKILCPPTLTKSSMAYKTIPSACELKLTYKQTCRQLSGGITIRG
jgi:hypothetical protein